MATLESAISLGPAGGGVSEAAPTGAGSEASLVAAAQAGDRAAFGQLYDRYAPVVHGILLSRVPYAEVDDLQQDVFLRALRQLPSLREAALFPAWLAAIARNRANDFYRRLRPVDELPESLPARRGSEEGEARAALEAICSLPEAYRETLILRLVEGMTGVEIAERTGLTHGSVRVNLHRGVKALRERLEGKQ